MTGFEGGKTARYTAPTPDEVQRAFDADRERARAAGYGVTRSWWDTQQPQPTFVVEYQRATEDPTTRGPGAPRRSSASRPRAVQARRAGGLGEALLVAGIILAAIIALAVAIPPSTPPPAPSPTGLSTPTPLPSPVPTVRPS